MKILVAYATAHGSTAEIAQFIGKVLSEREFDVTVKNVIEVESVDGYDAFVVGSPIHGGMWLTEMSRFLDRFLEALHDRPLYFFITCIRVLEEDGYHHSITNYVNQQVLKDLDVQDLTAFAGKLEMNAVNWEDRWTLAARYDGTGMPGSYNNDFRNWNTIRAWAMRVADNLLPN